MSELHISGIQLTQGWPRAKSALSTIWGIHQELLEPRSCCQEPGAIHGRNLQAQSTSAISYTSCSIVSYKLIWCGQGTSGPVRVAEMLRESVPVPNIAITLSAKLFPTPRRKPPGASGAVRATRAESMHHVLDYFTETDCGHDCG